MFRTNFMMRIRMPAWELLHNVKHKTSLQSLKDIHDDAFLMDLAVPVILAIEAAFVNIAHNKENSDDKHLSRSFKLKSIFLKVSNK